MAYYLKSGSVQIVGWHGNEASTIVASFPGLLSPNALGVEGLGTRLVSSREQIEDEQFCEMEGDGIVDGLLGTPHLQDSNPHLDKLESDYLYHFGYSKDDKNPSLKERFSDVKVRHLADHNTEQPNI